MANVIRVPQWRNALLMRSENRFRRYSTLSDIHKPKHYKQGDIEAIDIMEQVALFEYLIKTYTNKNETVLDNCMGSGTTAIACMNTERNFIGFELDETYYEKSLKRIKEHTTQTDIFDVLGGE